ncbi:Uncharacterized protein GBIM_20922 [Gryllus bimaculatus]|nr:Uncharacterized protein GBIM_20922 [Gryllus bimaculatus]
MALQVPIKELKQKVKMKKTVSDDLKPFYEQAKNLQNDTKYVKQTKQSPLHMTLPGSKYIGPGNSLNAGEPVNNADTIAFLHDWAYVLAKSPQDVQEADEIAINYFDKEFKQSGNWQALVGEMGLCVKHFVELKLGRVLYPSMSPGSETSRPESEVDKTSTTESRPDTPTDALEMGVRTRRETDHNLEELNRERAQDESQRRTFLVRFFVWILDFLRGRVCICGCRSVKNKRKSQKSSKSFVASSPTTDLLPSKSLGEKTSRNPEERETASYQGTFRYIST